MNLSPALRFLASTPWAVEFATFDRLAELVSAHAAGTRHDPAAVAALRDAQAATPSEPGITWQGRTAIVPIRGVVARYASGINGACQPQGRSAESIQADLMAAAERGADRIILRIDSPGGEVAGTAETAAMVRHISASGTPVIAFVDGLAASAAYWIASQADEIVASSDTAKVGSIGVAMPVAGGSGAYEVITSAPAKSGSPLNDAHRANARQIVADLATAFADGVAAGRGLDAEAAAALATGEVWTAQRAMALRLIDRIASWDQVLGKADAAADPAVDPVRRAAIAQALTATLTTSKPAAPSSRAEATQTTQPAAAGIQQESIMDAKLLAALAVMSAEHPTHAQALADEAAKPGATAASLEAFIAPIAARAKEEAHAAEVADLKAKLEAQTKRADEEKARADKAQAQANHGAPPDPGADSAAAKSVSRAKLGSMTAAEIQSHVAAGGTFTD